MTMQIQRYAPAALDHRATFIERHTLLHHRITIRPVAIADVPAMQDVIRRSFLVGYGRFVPWKAVQHWVATDMGGQMVAQEWESFTVAEVAGHIVGLVQLKENFVHELWVDPSYQRHGVGKALLEHAEMVSLQAGYLATKASVFAENLNALKFYLSQNWEPVGVPEPLELVPGVVLHVQKLVKF
ncbi:GNAT family N-acetyltransferase [Oscillatoria sp. FACHB-1407]|uniref:GNAT family N-acetyltransferase n=1 Tax=Oscillatoria sp. FACHB-1407 TaxID=2692847 RepID=UPI0016878906|nr:GNAT family N-acetyltransferase [Oscillatoria sp. FACHB-1407]MBD2463822.1 GNAT family N-acetyltransferase [Oscillatoria sp. FACHB-1407]